MELRWLIVSLLPLHLLLAMAPDSSIAPEDSLRCTPSYRTTILKDGSEILASYELQGSCLIFPFNSELVIETVEGAVLDPSEVDKVQKKDGSWKQLKGYKFLKVLNIVMNAAIWAGLVYFIVT